jgi:hypothetical protein
MRFFTAFVLFFMLFVVSCGKSKIEQGELEYKIQYPHSDISDFMLAMLPEKMTIVFKGTKMMTTIKKGKIFTTQIITDEKDKSIEMRLTLGNEKQIYTILDQADIEKLKKSQPVYKLTATEEMDSIGGTWAKKYTVVCETDSVENGDAWFTEDLAPTDAYWFTSYANIKGVPVAYDVERYGVFMRIEAQNFKQREVDEKEFDRDPVLKQVSFDEYEAEAQALFDLLMN